jgi:precorrin-3B synthase
VRVRLVGGQITSAALVALSEVAQRHGDGDLHLTGRANLQLRGLPLEDDQLTESAVQGIEATGLLPSRSHELVRNVMVSPQSGLAGGRADLRAVAARLDLLLLADPDLADLPGRFLFVLDDGRGDLLRSCDLGLVALDATTAQLRVGETWGAVVALSEAADALHQLARRFTALRGSGVTAAWHVIEVSAPLSPSRPADPRLPEPSPALPYGPVAGGQHVAAPAGVLSPSLVADLAYRGAPDLLVTPWRGVLVPGAST